MTDKFLTVMLLIGGLWLWMRNRPVAQAQASIAPGGQISPIASSDCKPAIVPTISVSGAPEQAIVPISEAAYYTVPGRFLSYRPPIYMVPERIPATGGDCVI